jgi:hypothetical protein
MIKLKDILLENEAPIKNFFQIKNEEDPNGLNHDLRLVCVKCGTSQTCRCTKPKREFKGICHKCAGINYNGKSI